MNDDQPSGSNGKNSLLGKLLILLFFVALGATLYYTGVFQLFMTKERLLSFIESLGPLGFIGFILLQMAQVVVAPIPGEVTGIIGGYLYGVSLGIVLSTIGLVLGSYLAFTIARAFGRPIVEKFVDKMVMDRFDYLLHHKGVVLVFMLFLLPGFPKDYLCFILGLGHLTTLEFLVISSVGRLFGTVLLTLGGDYIRCQQYGRLYILVGTAIVVVLVAYLFRNKVERLLRTLHVTKS
ncbi:MAG: TVP38/TMEM64 family protein [Acidobacteriota bacterium]